MAYTRSINKVALGSASTALAATLYTDFETTHALFKFPVVEEEDKEPNVPTECQLHGHPQRIELLTAAALFVFDEFPSLDREVFEGAYKAMNQFENKVIVCMGDFRQIAPVVKGGERSDTVNASIKSSPLWKKFMVKTLTVHLRLQGLRQQLELANPEQIYELKMQEWFARTLDAIGDGNHPMAFNENYAEGSHSVPISGVRYLLNTNDSLAFIYPNGFDLSYMTSRAILAVTNESVDMWNNTVQQMNPETVIHTLCSVDHLCEVDDPNDVLKNMLTEDVLHNFNNAGCPPHVLQLKVNDICILLRNLDKAAGLTNNRRVQVLEITGCVIKVQTLGEHQSIHYIPRIRFKFRLPYEQSYQLSRKQYPLRLAYAISINKAQGQELQRVVCDFRISPFSHGHAYVALTRVRHYSHIAILYDPNSLTQTHDPSITNVVYHELLL